MDYATVQTSVAQLATELCRYNGRSDCPWPTPVSTEAVFLSLVEFVADDPAVKIGLLKSAHNLLLWNGTTRGGIPATPERTIAFAKFMYTRRSS